MAHHEPFTALAPTEWDSLPHSKEDLAVFLTDTLSHAQTLVDSIPPAQDALTISSSLTPLAQGRLGTTGRARSHTDSAVAGLRPGLARGSSSSAITADALRREWKEIRLGARDNPLGMSVWKLAARDGKGSWFARRSLHTGMTFERWKLGLEREFAETLVAGGGADGDGKSQAPGEGNIRGIGAERRVESTAVDGVGKLEGKFYGSCVIPVRRA